MKLAFRKLTVPEVGNILGLELMGRVIRKYTLLRIFKALFFPGKFPFDFNKLIAAFEKGGKEYAAKKQKIVVPPDLPKFMADLLVGEFGLLLGRFVVDPPEEAERVKKILRETGKKDSNEDKFSRFISRVLLAAAEYINPQDPQYPVRGVTGKYHDKPLPTTTSKIQRQLDLLFTKKHMDLDVEGEISWAHVDAYGEIKAVVDEHGTDADFEKLVEDEMNNYAYCIFEVQEFRRFVHAFSLYGKDARVSIYDRAGVVHSEKFDITTHPLSFLQMILAFAYFDDKDLGYDPSVKMEGNKRTINIRGLSKWHSRL